MANTPRDVTEKVLERGEESILRAFRVAGENVTGRTSYEKNLRADLVMKQRIRIRQLLALMYADCKGGASKADVMGIRDAFGGFIEDMYGEEKLDCDTVNMAEEVAEGPHEIAQMRLMQEKSGPAAREFLRVNRAYEVANDRVERFAHNILSGARA